MLCLLFLSSHSSMNACVSYNPDDGTYTVDKSGCMLGQAYREAVFIALNGDGYIDSQEAAEVAPYIEQETERQEDIREQEEALK